MKINIITIGDEILLGQTIDSNSAFIAQQLAPLGFEITRIWSAQDKKDDIVEVLDLALSKADIIIMTGGLGPTKDDITKKCLADYFKTPLVRDPRREKDIRDFFEQRGRPILESNLQQADLPADAEILYNEKGTAAGMVFNKEGKIVLSMPGVPYEMKHILVDLFIPFLNERFSLDPIQYEMVMTAGKGESFLVEEIKDLEDALDEKAIEIAYLPSPGQVKIRLKKKGGAEVKEELKSAAQEIAERIHSYVFATKEISLEARIKEIATSKGLTLATAESCTGGKIAASLVEVPGSSAYFKGGVVAYDNEIKINQLEVDTDALEAYGAVSKQVVEQMALGALFALDTDFAVATSGIAGPDGGTEDKPVGTVWIAVASRANTVSKCLHLGGDRKVIIESSRVQALHFLYQEICKSELFD